jgi:hypothetical protein
MFDRTIARRRARSATVLLSIAATAVAGLALSTSADAAVTRAVKPAAVQQPTLVKTVPAVFTPNVNDGTVFGITQVGSWIVVGGSFTSVTPHGSSAAQSRPYLFAYDQATGAIDTAFSPKLDGAVNAVIPGPTAGTVYVGGRFKTVNGAKSKGLALLNLSNGAAVSGFKAPAMNGVVQDLRLGDGHLWIVGSFTTLGTATRQGAGTLNPTTGAVDSYLIVQLTGHHNYNGSGANGSIGGRALDISADGQHAVIVGNFKNADGVVHDQIVLLDLGTSAATIDPRWNTSQFSAPCARNGFDTYVEDVDFAPDSSYFVVADAGGGTMTKNIDGTRSLCDSVSRWATTDTGTNVMPTWVDYSGNDSFWVAEATGTAIYAGGHARWMNNPNGSDSPAAGAVPRPGIVALDPVNGMPYSWNPGRNPRGKGAYALYATSDGLYVGSDTDWIGNFQYKRPKLAYFPLAGGEQPPSTATATLPADVYQAGPLPGGQSGGTTANDLTYRPMSDSTVGSAATFGGTGVAWGSTRGAFMVGPWLYWDGTDGNFYRASFDGSTFGTPEVIDPYDDPAWSNVQTGSGGTYRGVKPSYYGEISSVTGQFYADGKIFYTLSGKSALYWRYFEADDGVIGQTENTLTGVDFSNVEGMFRSGSTIYWADRRDGTLHTVPFANDVPSAGGSTVSAPGVDWRARSLFLAGDASFPNQPPVASATVHCTGLTCTFDGTGSSDPDGNVTQWSWTFGDGTTGSGATVTHGYATGGNQNVTLTVTDNRGGTATWTGTADPTAPAVSVSFVGATDSNSFVAAPSVTAPTGIQAGDTELLFVSVSSGTVSGAPGGLSGWTSIAHIVNSALETTVYRRSAQDGDSGATVTVPLSTSTKSDVQFADYRGVSAAALPVATASDNTTSSHTAAGIDVGAAGSWVLTYWADKSSGTTAWSLPNSVTARVAGYGSGGGRASGVTTDSGGAVPTGSYGPLTATTDSVSGRGNAVTLVLPAAS